MSTDPFPQTVIAVIWDFDQTLTPEYMQKPLFDHFGIDMAKFWREVNELPKFHKRRGFDLISSDTLYLNHILTYVRHGEFKGLTNRMLFDLGKDIKFFPGLPEFFGQISDIPREEPYKSFDLTVEHYIVSTGLRKMILGSAIAQHVKGVWGCEFVSEVPGPNYLDDETAILDRGLDELSEPGILTDAAMEMEIQDIGYVIDNTTKTRAVFEINKGTNINPDEIPVNAFIPEESRRVPFNHMIYIADGPSDVPVFSVVKRFNGTTYAVFKPGDEEGLEQVDTLSKQGRIDHFGEADYTERKQTSLWIALKVRQIADKIVESKRNGIKQAVGLPPRHLS